MYMYSRTHLIDGAKKYDREIGFPIEICIHHATIDCQSSPIDDRLVRALKYFTTLAVLQIVLRKGP